MLHTFQLLRNIGQFDNVSAGARQQLNKLSLVYAENGRGKTTLAAILRSLGGGGGNLVSERRRLGSQHPPIVVISLAGQQPVVRFENGVWTNTLPNLTIFDDVFVAQNVCSGMEIELQHRQNLHELILGAEGVALNAALRVHIERIEIHNRDLRTKAAAIPGVAAGNADAFCALENRADVKEAILQKERELAAAKSSDEVRQHVDFAAIGLPPIDVAGINRLLDSGLQQLDALAVAQVQAHLARLGAGGEAWVADGMRRVRPSLENNEQEVCPFCSQSLDASLLIDHYRAYFSQAYDDLKAAIVNQTMMFGTEHGAAVQTAFERAVRILGENLDYWRTFVEVPAVQLDTAHIARIWQAARQPVLDSLAAKQRAPLDRVSLSAEAIASIREFNGSREALDAISVSLQRTNRDIAIVKEKAATANIAALSADLIQLKEIEHRHSDAIAPLCQVYMDEKEAKAATERQRDETRVALDQYRDQVFPAYQAAINNYLARFNAGFRLFQVTSVNNRGGSTCSYQVLINNIAVDLTGPVGQPTFKNTLSAGDRNTLALAFFFASIDRDPNQAQKVVVIDDPMTSLDEHRSLTTIQEVRRLSERVDQLIVLSHSKPFLCALWDGADTANRMAMQIFRDVNGSSLAAWDVSKDAITEHDRRHELVNAYIQRGNRAADARQVAMALRPIMESFFRVAYPEHFPPEAKLGQFHNLCLQRQGTLAEILSAADTQELRNLLDYANRFHHDTNPAWEVAVINDQELLDFGRRTIEFTRRN